MEFNIHITQAPQVKAVLTEPYHTQNILMLTQCVLGSSYI